MQDARLEVSRLPDQPKEGHPVARAHGRQALERKLHVGSCQHLRAHACEQKHDLLHVGAVLAMRVELQQEKVALHLRLVGCGCASRGCLSVHCAQARQALVQLLDVQMRVVPVRVAHVLHAVAEFVLAQHVEAHHLLQHAYDRRRLVARTGGAEHVLQAEVLSDGAHAVPQELLRVNEGYAWTVSEQLIVALVADGHQVPHGALESRQRAHVARPQREFHAARVLLHRQIVIGRPGVLHGILAFEVEDVAISLAAQHLVARAHGLARANEVMTSHAIPLVVVVAAVASGTRARVRNRRAATSRI
mmetsp:Transcript_3673/g.14844  ORF Transcript_3673/g.14844 Transcript_3673/m.14844 type:complete len:304 (-) Transcript_3673:1037-1948(-)